MNKIFNRFKFPIVGLFTILKKDNNFLFHLLTALIVIIFCFVFKLNMYEWLFVLIAIFIVLITEVLNTSIEYIVDMYTDDFHILAKHAKDTAALAVLLASILAIIIGIIIFLPKILNIF